MTTEKKPIKATSVELVERVFQRLAATYCAEWHRSIEGTPLSDVKAAWAHELSGFLASRETMLSVAWALENLPERAPNAIAFRNLCRAAPSAPAVRLDAPRADTARVEAELAKLGAVREVQDKAPPKAWAKRIISRHAGGENLSPTVLAMARAATRYEPFYDVHGQMCDAAEVAALSGGVSGMAGA